MTRAGASICLAFAFLALQAQAGYAADKVAIVTLAGRSNRDAVSEEASARIKGELEGAGIEVIYAHAAVRESVRDALERLSAKHQSLGAIALVQASQGGPEIWVHDASVGRTVVQRLVSRSDLKAYASSILAVRAVEFLRANLAAMAVPAPAPAPARNINIIDVAPTMPTPEVSLHPGLHPFLGPALAAGFRVLAGGSGLPNALAPALTASWGTPRGYAVRGTYVLPLNSAAVASATGRAEVNLQAVTLQALVRLYERQRFAAYAFAESGTAKLTVRGQSDTPERVGVTNHAWAFLAGGGLGGLVRITRWASLNASVAALAVVPRLVVSLEPEQPARLQSPALQGELSVCVGF